MSETKVITEKVRFSYCHVFEAKAIDEGSVPKYSTAILIRKKDKKTLAKIATAIEAAKEIGKSKKWGGKIPPASTLKLPLRDGDEERPDDENYAGCMFLNASSTTRPSIVDENVDPILDKTEFYSGCFGRASINFYPFSASGNKGVAAGLNNLQKLEDGENLGGSAASAESDFGSETNDLM